MTRPRIVRMPRNIPGTSDPHKDGCFTRGLGVPRPVDWIPPAEMPDGENPLVLSTGRRLYRCHTRTQTGRPEGLNDLLSGETAGISQADAAFFCFIYAKNNI